MALKLSLLEAGYTEQFAFFAERDAPLQKRRFPATAGLLEHPTQGLVLFDTAYSPFFHDATRRFPERIHALVTPVTIDPQDTVAAQLERRGYSVNDVRHVILSHFHADHIGGARLFPKAAFVTRRLAYEAVRHRSRLSATFSGFLRALLPSDFDERVRYVDEDARTALDLGPFQSGFDVFRDGSVVLIDLPGHATGQMGAYVSTTQGPVLLSADAAWSQRNFSEGVHPHPLAHVVIQNFNGREYHSTLQQLSALHLARPDVRILPCHCGRSHEAWEESQYENNESAESHE